MVDFDLFYFIFSASNGCNVASILEVRFWISSGKKESQNLNLKTKPSHYVLTTTSVGFRSFYWLTVQSSVFEDSIDVISDDGLQIKIPSIGLMGSDSRSVWSNL